MCITYSNRTTHTKLYIGIKKIIQKKKKKKEEEEEAR